MHLIYVSGSNPATDKALIAQIRRLPVGARLAEAANAADAITEVRKVAGAKIAILLSPTLGETDIVPLILDVRYEAKAVAVIGLVFRKLAGSGSWRTRPPRARGASTPAAASLTPVHMPGQQFLMTIAGRSRTP